MNSNDQITIDTPAKINLFLKVLGRRPDGYHEIYSLMQTVNLYDTLVISRAKKGIELICDYDDLPVDNSNLICRAFNLLDEKTGLPGGVRVKLTKRIPVGAGLGGGSSDAAATLKGINKLLNLAIPVEKLVSFSEKLGSDIPFFFSTGTSMISGRGEVVVSVNVTRNYKIVLITPDFQISTAWAYKQLRFPLTSFLPKPKFNYSAGGESLYKSLNDIGNDFEAIVMERHPRIADCMECLRSIGARYVTLSGSGGAFLGLFDFDTSVDFNAVVKEYGGWRAYSLSPVLLS